MLGNSLALTAPNAITKVGAGNAGERRAQNWVRFARADADRLTLSATLTGAAASRTIAISGWLDMKSLDTNVHVLLRSDNGSTSLRGVLLTRPATGFLGITLYNNAGTTLTTYTGSTPVVVASGKTHFYFRADGVANTMALYINGALDATGEVAWTVDNTQDIGLGSETRWILGAGNTAANPVDAEVSDLWLAASIPSGGAASFYPWTDLGESGVVNGVVPLIYFGGRSRQNTDTALVASKGWQDGYNWAVPAQPWTPTGTIENAPGKVRFNSTVATYLRCPTTLTGQPTAGMNSFLVVVRLLIRQDYRQVLLRGYDTINGYVNFNISLGAQNRVAVSGFNSSNVIQFGIGASIAYDPTNGTILPFNEPLLIACSGRSTTGGGQALALWHYNYATKAWAQNSATVGTLPVNDAAMIADQWQIGDDTNYKLNSEMSMIALDMAADGSSYVDLSSGAVRANLLLTAADFGVGTPQILFGESTAGAYDNAAVWNAGTNRGGGAGVWTMTSTVTDV